MWATPSTLCYSSGQEVDLDRFNNFEVRVGDFSQAPGQPFAATNPVCGVYTAATDQLQIARNGAVSCPERMSGRYLTVHRAAGNKYWEILEIVVQTEPQVEVGSSMEGEQSNP